MERRITAESLQSIDVAALNRLQPCCDLQNAVAFGYSSWALRSISPSICLAIGNIKIAKRFRLFGDENGAMDGALCRRWKDHCRELPIHRCAGLA
jgi:hypothetical protein